MNKAAIDVAQALARLSELTIFELRGEWRRLHRMPPPMRFSRDLLTRGISYKLQERAYGGLSTATARKLERASADPLGRGAVKPAPPISLKSGTRLVREWRGVTHTVLIHADGIEWRGQRYRSLSVVAREITGARWSGPRFFGLRRQLDSRLKGGGGRWRRLIAHEPGPPSAARSTPANRPTRPRGGIQFSRRPAGTSSSPAAQPPSRGAQLRSGTETLGPPCSPPLGPPGLLRVRVYLPKNGGTRHFEAVAQHADEKEGNCNHATVML